MATNMSRSEYDRQRLQREAQPKRTIRVVSRREAEAIRIEAAIKVNTSMVSAELLPPGPWDRLETLSDDLNKQECYVHVSENALRVSAPERIAFVESLNVQEKIVQARRLNAGEYVGYLIMTANGNLIALLESPHYGNALYAFDAAHPKWFETACKPRQEVISGGKPFLKRFYHRGLWKQKVGRFLSTPYT